MLIPHPLTSSYQINKCIQLMQKFIFTLKRKCLRWSGPLSWTKRNSGGCHLLLLQISIKADTGCLPAEKKITSYNYLHIWGNKFEFKGKVEQEEIQNYSHLTDLSLRQRSFQTSFVLFLLLQQDLKKKQWSLNKFQSV